MTLGIISWIREEDFIKAKEKGLSFVELDVNDRAEEFLSHVDEVRTYSGKYGLPVRAIGRWGSDRISGKGICEEELSLECRLIDAAEKLGCTIYITGCNYVEALSYYENCGLAIAYLTMRNYKLIDNIWGLVLAGGLPVYNVILAMNFFKNLPSELEEAALVDGAGPWRIWASIYVPLAKPSIATITLFTIVGYWNEFFQGLVLSTKETSYPLQTYIQQMVVTLDYSTMNVEQIAAASKLNNQSLDAAKIFIAMIPVLVVYPFLQKYFVKGITLGSVKG